MAETRTPIPLLSDPSTPLRRTDRSDLCATSKSRPHP